MLSSNLYLFAPFSDLGRNVYQIEPEIQMEEYAPAMIPTIIGSANSLLEGTPNT